MTNVLLALVEALFWTAVVVGVLHAIAHAAWRFFELDRGRASVHFFDTDDGWRLAVSRYSAAGEAPRRRHPLLLCPGTGFNGAIFDVGEVSLARELSAAGFDLWILDPRGRGDSARPRLWGRYRRHWSFDELVDHDLPRALDKVCEASGAARVHLLGFGSGGLAACVVAAGEAGQRVASVAAIGSAAFFGRQQEYLSARLLLLLRLMRPQLPARLLSPLLGRFDLPLLRPLQNLENVDSAVYRRALLNALEQSASREIQQLADWIELDSFRALEEGPDYRESLARLRAPVMFLAAPRDRLAPPSMVQATCDACDGADTREVVFATRSGGFSCNYGHLDMLIGRNVGRDVVPALVGWVERWDGDDGEGG